MKRFWLFEISVLLTGMLAAFSIAAREISIDNNHIPTILNGLTSSISVIVAFTGVLITFGLTGSLYKFSTREKERRIMLTVISLGLPLASLWTAYSYLLDNNYHDAVKVAMMGLLIALGIFIDFIGFLNTRKTRLTEQTADKREESQNQD